MLGKHPSQHLNPQNPPPHACQGTYLNAITVTTFIFFNEEDLEEGESKSSDSFLHAAAFGELAPHDLLWRCRVSSTLRQKAN